MVFSSLTFLFLFLPGTLAVYYLCPRKCRHVWLFLVSIAFYACGETAFLPVFLCGILWNYLSALLIGRLQGRLRKAVFILCLAGDLCTLFLYKYTNAFVLPLGISFFTFQEISYVTDVFRGAPPQKNPLRVGLYIAFFPQLIAGPIVRYGDFADQLDARPDGTAAVTDGFFRFTKGLCKKVLLANPLGEMTNSLLAAETLSSRSGPLLLLGIFGFALQLYFDFSGYSDMAIGLGRMFGFRIKENFRDPFLAENAADFWRRWHISLSKWFRDYVYIPLGGSRGGNAATVRNLLFVWLLTGIWHGAGWPPLLWGLLWGVWLCAERFLIRPREKGKCFRGLYRAWTVLLSAALFLLLRVQSLSEVRTVLARIFTAAAWSAEGLPALTLWLHDMWIYLLFAVLLAAGLPGQLRKRIPADPETDRPAVLRISETILLMLGFVLCISYLTAGSYNPFLYFQF